MFLPLGTDRTLRRDTLVNHLLIGVNVAAYGAVLLTRAADEDLFERVVNQLALWPGESGIWTYVTYAFMHDFDGFLHIAGNMLFLWVFGPNVEDRLGRLGYLAFYLLGAVAAGLAQAVFDPVPMIGASGAVAAVTGAYLILFPRTNIKTLVFFFFIGVFMIPAPWFIGAKIFFDFVVTGLGMEGNVATVAHLGGYAFGAAVAMTLLATKLLEREPYDMFTLGRQAHRRRQFREANHAVERAKTAGAGVHRPVREKRRNPDELPPGVVEARSRVANLVATGDIESAASEYRALLDDHGNLPRAGVLGRRAQLELCKGLYTRGDHDLAACACTRFVDAYPTDPETASVKLMLGLINARYLNDPVRAKALIREARDEVRTDDERILADQLMEELG